MTPAITAAIPVFRSFDERLARAFYVDWLGFEWEGGHRVAPDAPLYAFLRLGAFRLHLTEHHGDCTPGATAMVEVTGLTDWHGALLARPYAANRPGLEPLPWGLQMTVTDPFANRLRFLEPGAEPA
jgi:hypothetical protein